MIKIFCDVYNPDLKKPYTLDPRSVARKAQDYIKQANSGDTAYFEPEIAFFIFDNVKVVNDSNQIGHHLDSEESLRNAGRDYATGNVGHRPASNCGHSHETPIDSLSDIRAEMLSVIESMGVVVNGHYHGSASGQCALGICRDKLLDCADNLQICKYAVRNVAHSYGKSATFMPKPINGEDGSFMHISQSLWQKGKSVFSGEEYAGLSETALYYIGGILKHARVLNAFTNPTTNSYKRLLQNSKAPTLLTYSRHKNSVACSIPYSNAPARKDIQARFPDPTANPYLSLSALLMAGLDGIENKIHPGKAFEGNICGQTTANNAAEEKERTCASSLRQSLEALKCEHSFLLKGDVFTEELINSYIELKEKELEHYETMTHPVEVDMYYSS